MPVNPFLAVGGLALVLLAAAETISTAIRVDERGGPVTRWLSSMLWRSFQGSGSDPRRGPPSWTGVAITTAVVGTWGLLAVGGWFLLFSSDASAVVDATTGEPADGWARLYFTGYTLFTLGLGDFVPAGAPWQVATAGASAFGFGTATLVITYLAGVVSAVTTKRQLARTIWGLGDTAQQVVERAWDGRGFTVIDDHLLTIGPMLQKVAEQHMAYPLITYFRSGQRRTADLPAVARLQDIVSILDSADETHRPSPLVTAPIHDAMDAFLQALPGATDEPDVDAPPWPEVGRLRQAGVPVRSPAELPPSEEARRRRRRLATLLRHQGWAWQDLDARPRRG